MSKIIFLLSGLFIFSNINAQDIPKTIYELYGLKKGGCEYEKGEVNVSEEMVEEDIGFGEPPLPEGAVVTIDGLNDLFSNFKEQVKTSPREPKVRTAKLKEGNIVFFEKGKWGLKDKNGAILLNPQFDYIFRDTFAGGFSGYKNGLCNYYSPDGGKIFKNEYHHIEAIDKNTFIVRGKNGFGLIKDDKTVIEANNNLVQRGYTGEEYYYKIRTSEEGQYVLKDDFKTKIPMSIWDAPNFVGKNHVLFWNNIVDLKKNKKLICEEGYEFILVSAKHKIAVISKSRKKNYYLIDFKGNILSDQTFKNVQKMNKNGIGVAGINPGNSRGYIYEYGLINKKGKWVIKPQYSNIYQRDDYWMVSNTSGKFGLMDDKGAFVIPLNYDRILRLETNKYLCVTHKKDGKKIISTDSKIINVKSGKVLREGLNITALRNFKSSCNPNHKIASVPGGEQVLDENFVPVTPVHPRIFHSGKNYIGARFNEPVIRTKKSLYDCEGNIISFDIAGSPVDTFKEIKLINKNLTYVELIDGNGYLIPKDGEATLTPFSMSYFSSAKLNDYLLVRDEGNNNSGLIDQQGNVIIEPKIKHMGNFIPDTGMAIFTTHNKQSGLLTNKGELFQNKLYDEISYLGFGLYRIYSNKKYGVIDKNGNIIIPLRYDYLYSYKGLIQGGLKRERLLFDLTGKPIK